MTDTYNPWAGLASYEDPKTARQKLKFCGRDDDSYDLARLIMGNVFVTLYGKSGIGKTSLLNAGVFPELRQEQYSPDSLRLGIRDEEHPQSYQAMIIEAAERIATKTNTIDVIAEQKDPHAPDYLWNYFARHRFYDKNDEPTTPVFVFDQFEEVFRGHRDEAEILLKQLDYLNDKDHALDRCEIDGQTYRYEQNYRFVVSIREDDLYLLEDSIDNCYLPALKRCRYRLRSLTEEGARDAILIPGKGLFNPGEEDAIAKSIISKSRNDDGSISTNIISLLCSRIYVDYKKSGENHITPLLVDNFLKGNPFEQFYNEATRGFSDREKSYIEDNFVDSAGRRNSIPESNFLKHVPNGAALLEGDKRILQRTSTSSDGKNNRIELIHDSFCEPLLKLKEKRIRRKRLLLVATVLGVALLCIGVASYIFYQSKRISHQNTTISEQQSTIEQYNEDLLRERDSLRQMNNRLNTILQNLEIANTEKDSANSALQFANRQKDNANIRLRFAFLQMDSTNTALQIAYHQMDSTNSALETLNTNLDRQGQKLRLNESKFLAGKANELIDQGNPYLAKMLALEALPPNRPYTAEAEYALRQASNHNNAILRGHTSTVNSASFSPDGKYIVSASDDNTVRIWDAKTGQQVGSPLVNVTSASFSPDGRYIVSASADKTVRIWDTKAGVQVGSPLEGHTDYVTSASFSPDGRYIVSASWDKTVRIWDAKTGQQVGNPLKGHTNYVNSASFSPDGRYIVSASDDCTVRIWDAKTGQQVGSPLEGHTAIVNSASFSPDGRYIVSASDDNTVRIWDAKTGQQVGNPLAGHTDYVLSASFSPDGRYIVSASVDRTVRIWDAKTGLQVGNPLEGYTSASFSPDGRYIVSASWDKTVRIWDAKTGQQVGNPLEGHTDLVYSASFSPDGKYIVSASYDKIVRIWDAKTGQQVGNPLEGHTGYVYSASFSPDGRYIVSASYDKTVRIWKFPSLQELIDSTRERFKDRPLTPEERRKYYLD